MEVERGTILFDIQDLWLKVIIRNDTLHLRVFDRLTQHFHATNIAYDVLPKPANYLFESINELFSYFQELAARVNSDYAAHIAFEEPHLKIKDIFVGSQRQFKLIFQLKRASSEQRLVFLSQQLKVEESRLQELKDRCNFQYKVQCQNHLVQKALMAKLVGLNRREKMLEEIKLKKLAESIQIQHKRKDKRESLDRIRCLSNLYGGINEEEEQEKGLDFTLPQVLPRHLSIDNNTIRYLSNPSSLPVKLRSASPVPLYGKWTLRIKHTNSHNGLTFGFTSEIDNQSSINFHSRHVFGVWTKMQSSYTLGLQNYFAKAVRCSPQDVFRITVDRGAGSVSFFQNEVIFEEIVIPSSIQDARIFPFIEFQVGDEIVLIK